ncbi:MAG TPA: carboxypeptidase-like regulatory domain-containing protein, partial [Bacteroidia bacterium]|nr:carboxypeptidase-like regulatory domain-containing protein [Bacteroidia bacterium]
MKKFYFLFAFFLTASWSSFGQGIVRGKVSDESGESLIGVVVCLQSNKGGGVLTDLDGNFSIKVPEATTHTLLISYVSYKTIEQIIQPLKKNEVVIRNFTMLSNTTLETIVIEAKRVKASDYFMENIKKRSASTIDYISSETMKKTGDNTVVAAVARVSGVSSSGGLITVRGIGDRYVKTTLNGSRIPTLDPLTNNIKLDLFPASLVDNIIITKTASPDQPGDWSGAYLSIETKDYPEKLSVNIESQFGYNAQTTFKDYLSSSRSSTDWLGFDTGLRDKNHGLLVAPVLTPNNYQEMVALGLGDYYSSIGIKAPWDITSPEGQTYFKLGLVQLGLLAPALINDPASFNAAKAEYDNVYKKKAFAVINPDGSDYNNGMSNNWNLIKRKAPLNFSQNFSLGNQTTLFKKQFGYFLGLRYGSSIRYDPNGLSQRVRHEVTNYEYEYQERALISRETNGWSALVNLAYKFNDKNSMSFLYMPNFSGTNDVADFTSLPDGTIAQEGRTSKNQFYEQRKQLIYQLKSEHFIPGPEFKIDF